MAAAAPKPRKSPKNRSRDDAYRWVAKSRKKARDDDADAPPEVSLEEFRSEWPSPPDASSTSNKDYYFNSYAHSGIHEDMLKDQVRTGSYMKAIVNNRHLFEGKTVLDVGSGTGILCLFAAKAGAARCIGIECSDVVHVARAIAKENGYEDSITYIHSKVEEAELPADKVDIIISEWMGYFLIYESMLDSVLLARDKWLVEGGLLFPDHAKLYLAAIEDADYKEEKIGFWGQLWGFDFTPMQGFVMQEPISDTVNESTMVTQPQVVLEVNLYTVKVEDLQFVVPFALKVTRKDYLHALVAWFDVTFEACKPHVMLSTAPGKPYTHWKQTVLYLGSHIAAHPGEQLEGVLCVRKSKANPRDLDVKLEYSLDGIFPQERTVQYYRLR
eukprot:NODE_5256_length_1791_cov_7.694111.p1 GENE.NODE_5256_length_1791_cov_7.694111~~NODE_5256_length_1791_cov_7.694111.p1  ORF type:complete len:414 (+),score=143.52 NODE_5256_length_1791_cov_7.694111:90-1244(+)